MQTRLILGGALIFAALAIAAVTMFFENTEAYYTVDELVGDAALYTAPAAGVASAAELEPAGRRMQVRGDIDKASVVRAGTGLELRFSLTGKDHALPVVYEGVVPDTFDQAVQVTVGGRARPDGVFVADQLFVQCPSKYEAAPPGLEGAAPPRDG